MKTPWKFILGIFIALFLLTGLELVQRVKYYLKSGDRSYLFYGATDLELSAARYFKSLGSSRSERNDASIVIVGGSTVKCSGLPQGSAWPEQLERLFREGGDNAVTVFNLGENGSSSSKDAERLRSYLRTHSPSMIIFCTGINDSAHMLAARWGRAYTLPDKIRATFPARLNAILLKHSLFYTALREKLAKVFSHDINRAYAKQSERYISPEEKKRLIIVDNIGVKLFRENLTDVIRLSEKMRIILILGLPPIAYEEDELYAELYKKLKQEMGKISDEYSIPFIDIAGRFSAMGDKGSLFFPDLVHVNAKGARREAEVVYDYLKSHSLMGLVESPRR